MSKQSDQKPDKKIVTPPSEDKTTLSLEEKTMDTPIDKAQTPPEEKTPSSGDNKSKVPPSKPFIKSAKTKSLYRNTGIGIIALIVALLGSSAVFLWTHKQITSQQQLLQEQAKELNQQLEQRLDQQALIYQQQEDILKGQLNNTENKLKHVESLVTTLKASQQNLTEQLAKINVDSSKTWKLFEAQQLLKQTFLRLRVSDINGAITLLDDINTVIKEQGDLSQSATNVSLSIENALLKLQQAEQVDRSSLYSELAALQEQILKLEPKKPVFQKQTTNAYEETASYWDRWSNKLSGYVKINFNVNNQTLPFLNEQGLSQLRMTLDLAMEKAQWAALNSQPKIYLDELNRSSHLITLYFDSDANATKALLAKIDNLKTRTVVTQVPDISDTLSTINDYLNEQIQSYSQRSNTKGGTIQ